MTVLQTIAVAFAMFSALPVPQFEWNEKNMRYAMCAFPLIGLVCGGLWCLCGVLPLPELARAAAFCLVPVAVTGGIHLDGYADTSDALSSYGDREKKLEILKDSHCGAFAVIRLCCYFVAYFGLCGSVRFTPRAGLCWTLALVLERALSGFAVAAFPLAKDTGLAHTFATAADKQTVCRFLCGLSALLILALTALGGGGLAAGVSTLAKLLNPNVKVIGVEPEGAACMKASLEAGHVVSLPTANTIADGTAVKTPGDKVFPYIRDHVDQIITIPDTELVEAFLDVMEKHKMVVENSGLLSVAALRHLSCQGLNVVCVLSGGNMDVITMASLVQHGLIMRGRIFTFSVLLPDRPGALLSIADILARENGNVIKLEHNQFVNINRQSGVELKVTLEAFGHDHKDRILEALSQAGYQAHEVDTTDFYH